MSSIIVTSTFLEEFDEVVVWISYFVRQGTVWWTDDLCGGFLDKLLEKDIAKQKITSEEAQLTRGRVKAVDSMGPNLMEEVDLVIEVESKPSKKKVTITHFIDQVTNEWWFF